MKPTNANDCRGRMGAKHSAGSRRWVPATPTEKERTEKSGAGESRVTYV
jgi:hypothetical protein